MVFQVISLWGKRFNSIQIHEWSITTIGFTIVVNVTVIFSYIGLGFHSEFRPHVEVLVLPFDMVDIGKHKEAVETVLQHFGKVSTLMLKFICLEPIL